VRLYVGSYETVSRPRLLQFDAMDSGSRPFPRLQDREYWARLQEDDRDERERLIRRIERQQELDRWRY